MVFPAHPAPPSAPLGTEEADDQSINHCAFTVTVTFFASGFIRDGSSFKIDMNPIFGVLMGGVVTK
jgi:hypothetical protein